MEVYGICEKAFKNIAGWQRVQDVSITEATEHLGEIETRGQYRMCLHRKSFQAGDRQIHEHHEGISSRTR